MEAILYLYKQLTVAIINWFRCQQHKINVTFVSIYKAGFSIYFLEREEAAILWFPAICQISHSAQPPPTKKSHKLWAQNRRSIYFVARDRRPPLASCFQCQCWKKKQLKPTRRHFLWVPATSGLLPRPGPRPGLWLYLPLSWRCWFWFSLWFWFG